MNHGKQKLNFTFLYFYWYQGKIEFNNNKFDLTDIPLLFFVLIVISLFSFSFYFNNISANLGGPQKYKKVLYLKEKEDFLIKTDPNQKTDTLTIIYENNEYIYFKENSNLKSIKRDYIAGEILIK